MGTGELAKALAAFQAEAPSVAKDKEAKVPTKSGGQYSYKYADLADIAQAAYPLLAKHGLSFSCCPRTGERGLELQGLLLHTSGESLEGVLPLFGGTPQELGSALTYMRRYLLGALTGIVTDADDDGALAQHRATRQEPSGWESRQTRPQAPPAPGQATQAQIGALRGIAKRQGISDDPDWHDWLTDMVGRTIRSGHELTKAEASALIERSQG
jgi:hypothetical protein